MIFFKTAWRALKSSIYAFIEDDCYTKASVLTFYTLQSIVPLLAFLIGIAKGFGFEEYLEDAITKAFSEQKDVMMYAIKMAHSMLSSISSGIVVGLGVVLLFWTNLNLLGYMENALNEIFKVSVGRTYLRKFTDYLAIMMFCLLMFVAMSSLIFYLKMQLSALEDYEPIHSLVENFNFGYSFLPLVVTWLSFFLFYYLLPNARLSIMPLIIAAIIAGSLFQIWQFVYVHFQSRLFNYNVVYGAFAALPLFVIWLQLSWLIALGGAELAAHFENIPWRHREDCDKNSVNKKELAILIVSLCILNFYRHASPLNDYKLSNALNLPLDSIRKILVLLERGGILTPVVTYQGDRGYHPLWDPASITLKAVCDVVDDAEQFEVCLEKPLAYEEYRKILNRYNEAMTLSEQNISFQQLSDGLQK